MKHEKLIEMMTHNLIREFYRSGKKHMEKDMMIEDLIKISVIISSSFVSKLMFSLDDIYPKKLNLPLIFCDIHNDLLEALKEHGGKTSGTARLIRQRFRRELATEAQKMEPEAVAECGSVAGNSQDGDDHARQSNDDN